MAKATSPTTGRCYGVARVCQVWDVPRSSFYAAQQASAAEAGPRSSPARRGPQPAISDADLLAAIRADLTPPRVRPVVACLGLRNEGARVIESGAVRRSIQGPHRGAATATGERGH
jgi:hypothetical protein